MIILNLLLKSPLALCNFWMLISKLVRILLIHGSGESLLIRVYSLTLLLYVPLNGKSGLVFCMLHRAKLICSSDWLFFKEVEILKSSFLSNNYPPQFFDKYCANFLRFHPIILKKTKTAMNARLAFLKFHI